MAYQAVEAERHRQAQRQQDHEQAGEEGGQGYRGVTVDMNADIDPGGADAEHAETEPQAAQQGFPRPAVLDQGAQRRRREDTCGAPLDRREGERVERAGQQRQQAPALALLAGGQ